MSKTFSTATLKRFPFTIPLLAIMESSYIYGAYQRQQPVEFKGLGVAAVCAIILGTAAEFIYFDLNKYI